MYVCVYIYTYGHIYTLGFLLAINSQIGSTILSIPLYIFEHCLWMSWVLLTQSSYTLLYYYRHYYYHYHYNYFYYCYYYYMYYMYVCVV